MSRSYNQQLATNAVLLGGFAGDAAEDLLDAITTITRQATFRHMQAPGGYTMSAAMSNCGELGWVSDTRGYRYTGMDPLTGKRWPAMPATFQQLATAAAMAAGFPDFCPDACLINRYKAGARMSLHQDRDEQDFSQPIVSVSLGLPMTFLFGGLRRKDKPQRIELQHGDVVVWGGEDRLRYHGVAPLKTGEHPVLGNCRINLTFRKAG